MIETIYPELKAQKHEGGGAQDTALSRAERLAHIWAHCAGQGVGAATAIVAATTHRPTGLMPVGSGPSNAATYLIKVGEQPSLEGEVRFSCLPQGCKGLDERPADVSMLFTWQIPLPGPEQLSPEGYNAWLAETASLRLSTRWEFAADPATSSATSTPTGQ
jgi:hypothetical protein